MRYVIASLSVLLAGLTIATVWADDAVSVKSHPDSTNWQNLFNPDLSNAIYPKGIWRYENGELIATEDQFIWTKKEYENFAVDLEFKNVEGSNSGVMLYCTDLNNPYSHVVEVQLLDDYAKQWASIAKNWQCAAIFGHQAPTKQMVKKPGPWNRMTVTCRGPRISVVLNGELVTELDMRKCTSAKTNPDGSEIPPFLGQPPLAQMPTKGHIGLQGSHHGVPTDFRNVKFKLLTAEETKE
jgi:hypothetical protein